MSIVDDLRSANPHGRRPEAPGAGLRGANLVRADLRRANLRGADLSRANLGSALLVGADLAGANLAGALMTRARLTSADLADADLTDADLCEADLTDANLAGANLQDATLSDANLFSADLRGANLLGADLENVSLARTLGGLLQVTGLHPYQALLVPTSEGWQLSIGCWSGTVDDLRVLIAKNYGWPEARGSQITERRPLLAALAYMCELHMSAHGEDLQAVIDRWGTPSQNGWTGTPLSADSRRKNGE